MIHAMSFPWHGYLRCESVILVRSGVEGVEVALASSSRAVHAFVPSSSKLHRSITNSWSASMISASFRAPDEFRGKIVSALRRLQAVPNTVRALFAHPDFHYSNT